MIIKEEEQITDKEGYEALLYMLDEFYKYTGSKDLTDILSGGEYMEENSPADPKYWYWWKDAIAKVKKNGPPPLKILCLDDEWE